MGEKAEQESLAETVSTAPPPYKETAAALNHARPTVKQSLFRRALNMNPGFCPGAVEMRDTYKQKPKDGTRHRLSYNKCAHCGLSPLLIFPKSYTKDWPKYARYRAQFAFECHVAAQRLDKSDRRSCVICWEDKGIWVPPMVLEDWGEHMRVHFKDEGYWMCSTKGDATGMASKYDCPSKKCQGIHC
ncbi:hypothetical protein N0V90_013463 [Kalmusia sp. IMI 367209]|nr:hypothetical protein N0V90_013463 [Kalmusia sp. IMI 367209]